MKNTLKKRLFLVLALTASGCGGNLDGDRAGEHDAGAGLDAAIVDASRDMPLVPLFDATSPGALQCSRDLREVVNPSTGASTPCPPDEGCFAGECVPACEASAQTKGTLGCDYLVPTPSFVPWFRPPCFAVFVANGWDAPAELSVEFDGTSYDVADFGRIAEDGTQAVDWDPVPETGVPPGEVAVLFLSSDPRASNEGTPMTCPITPAINSSTAIPVTTEPTATGVGKAFRIRSSVPVTSYDILPYGGADSFLPSASLLLPTTAFGDNYVTVVPPRGFPNVGVQWFQIVGAFDDTRVTILPNRDLPAGGRLAAAMANEPVDFTVNEGEYLQWQDTNDVTGSVILSDKPIGLFGGNAFAGYRTTTSVGGGGDSTHQMIPPVSALGHEYVLVPFETRRSSLEPETIAYRLVGAVDGTTLSFDPPIPGAPSSIDRGEVFDLSTNLPFAVASQDADHPFYAAQLMGGCRMSDGVRPGVTPGTEENLCLGDEEFVNVLPPAQYLDAYSFFTDPTYATTNLVVVRERTASGFGEVTLDCKGELTGWQSVGTAGRYEYVTVDLVRSAEPVGTCRNGPQHAASSQPFGITVWGLDDASSYAYPAGGNVSVLNEVVVAPLL